MELWAPVAITAPKAWPETTVVPANPMLRAANSLVTAEMAFEVLATTWDSPVRVDSSKLRLVTSRKRTSAGKMQPGAITIRSPITRFFDLRCCILPFLLTRQDDSRKCLGLA